MVCPPIFGMIIPLIGPQDLMDFFNSLLERVVDGNDVSQCKSPKVWPSITYIHYTALKLSVNGFRSQGRFNPTHSVHPYNDSPSYRLMVWEYPVQ
jgi:hypothetical protein